MKQCEAEGERICKCECGGQVRGIWEFERLWTWCEKCTPVVKITPSAHEHPFAPSLAIRDDEG